MGNRLDGARAHYNVGAMLQYRNSQGRNISSIVLVVSIGGDYNISAQTQTSVQAGHEGAGQSLVAGMAYNVIHATLPSNANGAIFTTIVNDQPLDFVEPWHLARQARQSDAQGFLFIIAGNLANRLDNSIPVG